MSEKENNSIDKSDGEDYECYRCHHKLSEARALPFAGRIICPRCLRNLLLPILIILVVIIVIIVLLTIV